MGGAVRRRERSNEEEGVMEKEGRDRRRDGSRRRE